MHNKNETTIFFFKKKLNNIQEKCNIFSKQRHPIHFLYENNTCGHQYLSKMGTFVEGLHPRVISYIKEKKYFNIKTACNCYLVSCLASEFPTLY